MKIVVTTLLSLLITILSFAQTEDNDMQFGFGVSLSNEYSVYIFKKMA